MPVLHQSAPPRLSQKLAYLMAAASGVAVANLYYLQPLLPALARDFHLSVRAAGGLATTTQVGYALGMLFLVPLGDSLERRRLIVIMLGVVTLALIALAAAPNAWWLGIACLLVGITTITPQLLIPFAANLAEPDQRGRVVGKVMSGLLAGVLLARTFSGIIGAHLGWRAVYGISSAIMVILAVVMWKALPALAPTVENLSYASLLRSLLRLVKEEPVLIESGLFGALAFASFSAFWTVLPFFLAQPPYGYASDKVGLFGFIGLTGILVAPLSGRWADQGHARAAIAGGLSTMLAGYACVWHWGAHLPGLIAGFLLLDLGATGNHIANQARVYSLRPEARSRINTVYMTTYFAGGAMGSLLGAIGWNKAGWTGLCIVGAFFPALALLLHAATRRR